MFNKQRRCQCKNGGTAGYYVIAAGIGIFSLCDTQIHTYNFAGMRADRRRALYSKKISERSADYENCSSKGAQILQRNTEKYF